MTLNKPLVEKLAFLAIFTLPYHIKTYQPCLNVFLGANLHTVATVVQELKAVLTWGKV